MYNLPQYKEAEKENMLSFMKAHPFVMLIGTDKNARIELTQIPVMIEEREGKLFLAGHIHRKSSHHLALEEVPHAVAVFTSSHSYISATWYTGSPNQASTWNYVSIHARGNIKWMSEEGLITFLKKLTLHYENYNRSATPVYENLPEDYTSRLIKGIIGFEMEVTSLENVYKLSQTRDEKSYDSIVNELKQKGDGENEIAAMMEERKKKLFPSS